MILKIAIKYQILGRIFIARIFLKQMELDFLLISTSYEGFRYEPSCALQTVNIEVVRGMYHNIISLNKPSENWSARSFLLH